MQCHCAGFPASSNTPWRSRRSRYPMPERAEGVSAAGERGRSAPRTRSRHKHSGVPRRRAPFGAGVPSTERSWRVSELPRVGAWAFDHAGTSGGRRKPYTGVSSGCSATALRRGDRDAEASVSPGSTSVTYGRMRVGSKPARRAHPQSASTVPQSGQRLPLTDIPYLSSLFPQASICRSPIAHAGSPGRRSARRSCRSGHIATGTTSCPAPLSVVRSGTACTAETDSNAGRVDGTGGGAQSAISRW